jgi:hypothetical protein
LQIEDCTGFAAKLRRLIFAPDFAGQWSMVNGQWSMVNGQWSMVNGQWSMVKSKSYITHLKSDIIQWD